VSSRKFVRIGGATALLTDRISIERNDKTPSNTSSFEVLTLSYSSLWKEAQSRSMFRRERMLFWVCFGLVTTAEKRQTFCQEDWPLRGWRENKW
jgi:hypothetical protein